MGDRKLLHLGFGAVQQRRPRRCRPVRYRRSLRSMDGRVVGISQIESQPESVW